MHEQQTTVVVVTVEQARYLLVAIGVMELVASKAFGYEEAIRALHELGLVTSQLTEVVG